MSYRVRDTNEIEEIVNAKDVFCRNCSSSVCEDCDIYRFVEEFDVPKRWITTVHGTDGRILENSILVGTKLQVKEYMMSLVEKEIQCGNRFSHATESIMDIDSFDDMLYAYANFENYSVDITAVPEDSCCLCDLTKGDK